MKTIKQAYRNEPLLTVIALAIVGIAVITLLIALPVFMPDLIKNPLERPAVAAIDLLQLATFLLVVVAAFAVYVDRRQTARSKQDDYADFFGQSQQPKRIRLGLGMEWTVIRNGQQMSRRMVWAAV